MDTSTALLAIIVLLGATALCVVLFERLGFGSILGFIVAGIAIGPHTPGPVASEDVEGLQGIAELGVVLFLFIVGLEMRPEKIWSMRRLLFGLGSAQLLVTAGALGAYAAFMVGTSWESAVFLGLAFAMSSTAIVMASLEERGQLPTEAGQTSFAILMGQDLWIVPVMALVPILAHVTSDAPAMPAWERGLQVVGALAGIFVVGRYLLPAVLGYVASRRRMETFGILLLFAVLGAAWVVDRVGISMTLGAFLLGMLLSSSDYRYQIEATIAPFKSSLMGLFFVAVGMSIDVSALQRSWQALAFHVPVVLMLKTAVLIALSLAFRISRSAAVRTGFYMSQVGELAFVLLGAAAATGLVSGEGSTLATLLVAVSMILTPLMMKAGDRIASRLRAPESSPEEPPPGLDRHVVVVGFDEVGQLICLMLEKAGVPYVAFDKDSEPVRTGKWWGKNVHFGDMYSPVTQRAAALERALAVYVSTLDSERAKGLALTLHRLYPKLDVFVRVRTLRDQGELIDKGIKNAGTGYIESTLVRGSDLLRHVGVSADEVGDVVASFRHDNYALVQAAAAEAVGSRPDG